MSRRDQLERLRAAEAAMVERRRGLHAIGRERVERLRRVPPMLLLTGGFFSGVLTHCVGRRLLPAGALSSLARSRLRLSRLAAGGALSDLVRGGPGA